MKLAAYIAASVLAACALALFVAGAVAAEAALHPARRSVAPLCPCIAHAQCGDAEIKARDGVRLRGWYFQPDRPNGASVLLLHGIGASRDDMVSLGALFLRAGYAVVEPDLRGHGRSEGRVTYGVSDEQDVQAWSEWMSSQNGVRRIYGFGASLGGSVLLESLNRKPRFRAVIAEAAFTDFDDIAVERLNRAVPTGAKWLTRPFVLSGILWTQLRYSVNLRRASALDAVRHTNTPVLLIAGLADDKTSSDNSRLLAASNPSRTELWLIPNCGHAEAWHTAGKQFEDRVLQWFSDH